MTDQTPEPDESGDLFEIDESATEPEKTTNFVDEQDDVEFDENQSTDADPGLYPDEDEPSPYEDVRPVEESGLGPFVNADGAE